MKKLISILFTGLIILFTTCTHDPANWGPDIPAEKSGVGVEPLSPEVEAAVETGVAWLITQQDPSSGLFGGTDWEGVARTALAVTKLCDRSLELEPPADPMDGPYATEIVKGLNYIFSNANDHPVPDGGISLTSGGHSVYNTGIAMMAVAAARCPTCQVPALGSAIDGYTFEQVLEATVDFFVVAQNPDGGWRYEDHGDPSDNSNTGFAVLGLLAAEGTGIEIPESLKSNLSIYIDAIQDDGNGGSWYRLDWIHNPWINTMKTGNLLFEMAFVGDPPDPELSGRAQFALEYIQNNWNDVGVGSIGDVGWQPNNYLAMYCLMKGFVSLGIETITVDEVPVDWYNDFVVAILGDPAAVDPWPLLKSSPWLDPYLSSIFAMLTLEKITPVPYIPVFVDVKPTSCPNPLNRKGKGVVPVAILGTDEFDVSTIDPSTVNIGGVVHPLKWSYEDVATPYEGGFSDPISKMDCTTEGPDGYTDLVLHFESAEIAALFADNFEDDLIVIELGGELKDDGKAIIGEDVMIVVK